MTVNLSELHARALGETREAVARIVSDQWDQPSVLDGMSVKDLVHHVVYGNFWVGPLMAGRTIEDVGEELEGDLLGSDPLAAYDRSSVVAADAFMRPGAMTDMVAVSYGPVPGEVYAGHRFMDVLIHGWDMAASTGQKLTMDPELVAACWDIVEPQAAMFAAAGAFAEPIAVTDDADPQTKLLALTGRTA